MNGIIFIFKNCKIGLQNKNILLFFIFKDKNIQKEDIQQIAHSNLNVILYFWEELK